MTQQVEPNTDLAQAISLTSQTVQTYQELFLQSSVDKGDLTLCLSEIDTAGLQVLVSLKKMSLNLKFDLRITLQDQSLMELISPTGLERFLFGGRSL